MAIQATQNNGSSAICTIPDNVEKPSVEELEKMIASIPAEQIELIARFLVGNVMNLLHIDMKTVERLGAILESSNMHCVYTHAKEYNPNSPLMKYLQPIFSKKLTEAFALPRSFIEKGIVFDLINENKNGLLDSLDDLKIKNQITTRMKERTTYNMTLNAMPAKPLNLIEKHFLGKQLSLASEASIGYILKSAKKCEM